MLHFVFSVYDSVSAVYQRPFVSVHVGEALRAIQEVAQDPKHPFCKHSSEFELFELGRWDDSTATFAPHSAPQSHGRMSKFSQRLASSLVEQNDLLGAA